MITFKARLTIGQGRHAGERIRPCSRGRARFLRGSLRPARRCSRFEHGAGAAEKATFTAAIASVGGGRRRPACGADGGMPCGRIQRLTKDLINFRHILHFLANLHLERHGVGPKGRFRIQD